jgi:hypothetical protein
MLEVACAMSIHQIHGGSNLGNYVCGILVRGLQGSPDLDPGDVREDNTAASHSLMPKG